MTMFRKLAPGFLALVFTFMMLALLPYLLNSFTPRVKAAQPRSAKVAYQVGALLVYCEEPSGNEVYVITPSTGGAGVYVVPGGCK